MNKDCSYVCCCGCTRKRNELVKVKTDKVQQLRCPEHTDSEEGRIKYRFTTCDECGVLVIFKPIGGTVPKFCDYHRHEANKEKMRKYMKERYVYSTKKHEYQNGHLFDEDRINCIHRGECLTKYCMTEYECIPCRNCAKYESGLLVDQYSAACIGDRACVFELSY